VPSNSCVHARGHPLRIATRFAKSDDLTADELRTPLRSYPRPSRLDEPLGLTGPAAKAAAGLGIETIGDLVVKTEAELAAIPNFGKKSVEEVKETLSAHGLTLRGDESGNGN